jgi:hypothetical protein
MNSLPQSVLMRGSALVFVRMGVAHRWMSFWGIRKEVLSLSAQTSMSKSKSPDLSPDHF